MAKQKDPLRRCTRLSSLRRTVQSLFDADSRFLFHDSRSIARLGSETFCFAIILMAFWVFSNEDEVAKSIEQKSYIQNG